MKAFSSKTPSGFSLIEVVLAVGIASTALVTAVALMGMGMNTQSASRDDTVIATMMEKVLSELRAARFDTLWDEEPSPVLSGNLQNLAHGREPEDSSYFFTLDGAKVPRSHPEAHYECLVQKFPDEQTRSIATAATPEPRFNLMKLELTFSSPLSAHPEPARRPNRQTLHATLARY